MTNPSVFVIGPDYGVSVMFAQARYPVVRKMEEASIHVWTGGADVDPRLYNEQRLPLTQIHLQRDLNDGLAWNLSRRDYPNALRVGICRGAQFLNVMSGGKLWQDIDGHTDNHLVLNKKTGELIDCTSTHHQQMIPGTGAEVLGVGVMQVGNAGNFACVSNLKTGAVRKWQFDGRRDEEDPEVVWYESTNSLCFQPHPEYRGLPGCTRYFLDLVKNYHEIAQRTQTEVA